MTSKNMKRGQEFSLVHSELAELFKELSVILEWVDEKVAVLLMRTAVQYERSDRY